jgi:hypothetical protein
MRRPSPVFIRGALALLTVALLGGAGLTWRQRGPQVSRWSVAVARSAEARTRAGPREWARPPETPRRPDASPADREPLAPPTSGAPGRELGAELAGEESVAAPEGIDLASLYRGLFRELDLPPGQAARLTALLAERARIRQDILLIAGTLGFDPRVCPPGIRALIVAEQGRMEPQIEALVGEAAFDRWRAYEQTLPQRSVALQLQRQLGDSDSPLSEVQVDDLVRILATRTDERERPASSPGSLPQNLADARDAGLIPSAAISQSWAILSQPQVALLEQLQRRQRAALPGDLSASAAVTR